MRQILLFLAFLFGIWWLRRKFGDDKRSPDNDKTRVAPPTRKLPEKISPCAHCGVLVPESEGVLVGERFYCCEAHKRLAERS